MSEREEAPRIREYCPRCRTWTKHGVRIEGNLSTGEERTSQVCMECGYCETPAIAGSPPNTV